jgi:hypothetical protein
MTQTNNPIQELLRNHREHVANREKRRTETPQEKDLRNLSCFTTDMIVRCYTMKYGMLDASKVQKLILLSMRIAAGLEKPVNWDKPFDDERFDSVTA